MNRKTGFIIGSCGLILGAGLLTFYLRSRAPEPPLRFWCASFSPDGKTLATGGGQGSPDASPRIGELILWDSHTGKLKRIFRQASGIRSLVWANDGSSLVIGDFAGSTTLIRPSTLKPAAFLPPHGGGKDGIVNSVSISADGKLVASGSTDGTVTLWDTAGKELDPVNLPPGERTYNVALSPDHSLLLAGGCHGHVYLCNLNQRGPPRVLEAYNAEPFPEVRVESVVFSPKGDVFATACKQTLRLWETSSGKLLHDIMGCTSPINALAFSPDGDLLATVDHAGFLTLWDTGRGDSVRSTPAHDRESFGVAFSPDGMRIVTVGREDFTGKIWDAQTLTTQIIFKRRKSSS